eukprot:789192_1
MTDSVPDVSDNILRHLLKDSTELVGFISHPSEERDGFVQNLSTFASGVSHAVSTTISQEIYFLTVAEAIASTGRWLSRYEPADLYPGIVRLFARCFVEAALAALERHHDPVVTERALRLLGVFSSMHNWRGKSSTGAIALSIDKP